MAPSLFFMLCTWIVLLVMIHTPLAKPLCHPDESSALMEFKRSFKIDRTARLCVYPKFESWSLDGHGDCCSWDGIECDEATGHVTGLDLSHGCLFGTLSSNTSLFHLLHLESLNLAWNDFKSSSIPYGFGNLSQLHYLNLSCSHLSGKVPSDISRLSRLVSLDLNSGWDLEMSLGLYWHNMLKMPNIDNFIQNLTMLKELDLSSINMSSPFPHVLANFSSLKSLKLGDCQLHGEFPTGIFQLPNLKALDISNNYELSGFIPDLHWGNPLKSLSLQETNFSGEVPISIGNLVFLNELSIGGCSFSGSLPTSMGNLSQLAHLDLSSNKFHGQIPAFFANLTHLSYLDLSYNNFSGGIGHWFVNLAKLTNLDLADCQLSGPITYSFENLTQLVSLQLYSNNLQGKIPSSIWELKDLEFLDLSGNNLSGIVDLHKLKKLSFLDLSFNNISFASKAEINATLPKLSVLYLGSCNLHEFPKFLAYLGRLLNIDLSNNNIEGSVPIWMCNGSRESLLYMDLSHNFLTGFENNQINIPLPNLTYLDISSNQLKTELPSPPPSMYYYNISYNFLIGDIQSICSGKFLRVLDLSNNSLNGTIPSCVGNMDYLSFINLRKNKLVGMIPRAYPKGCMLEIIDLSENRLQGPIPGSLANCTKLEYLNLAHNQILDGFPFWLSELTELKVVILKANKFYGPIEAYRSQFNFSYMHIMDLSYNSFNGKLPCKLLQSLHTMEVITRQEQLEYMTTQASFPDNAFMVILVSDMKLMNKGTEREYSKVPFALMQIDFSNNKFEGHIPDLIGDLKSLILLNLSSNVLTGSIPPSLANLTLLESLDLSQNKLSGEIPRNLAQLTFLSSFNVFNNQLSGPIPQGSQFNTFSINSFAMNEGLCGSPLPKKCTVDNLSLPPSPHEKIGEESLFNSEWKFVLIGVGVGFLIGIVLGNLIIDEKSVWFLHYSKRMAKGWKRLGRH